jgi:hypothetical protein
VQCRERQLVDAQGAGERARLHALDEHPLAEHDTRLRPSQQLVGAEEHEIRAIAQARGCLRLGDPACAEIDEATAAAVLDERQSALASERRELDQADLTGEALDPEVAAVDLQKQARVGTDRVAVVAQVGAVGRADLAQPRATRGHDLRHPERPADLDELATRDDHFAPGGERIDRQKERRCGVVHHVRGLGGSQEAEQLGDPGRA